MSSVTFIGLGGIARAMAARAIAGGNTVELIARDAGKARRLARKLGGGASGGTVGGVPAGDIVVLAVPYVNTAQVVAHYGDALAGKVIIDISTPFNAAATGSVTPLGTSGAQQIAKAVPASAHVVKAFNTTFGHVLTQGRSLDVFFAGDDALAKASVSEFIESLGLRPFDVGGLDVASWWEAVGPLTTGLASDDARAFGLSLGVDPPY